MVKHIFGMSIFQAIWICVFMFAGPLWMTEDCDPLTGPLYSSHSIPEIAASSPTLIDPTGEWTVENMENCDAFILNGMA
jgi:hypothetical protein